MLLHQQTHKKKMNTPFFITISHMSNKSDWRTIWLEMKMFWICAPYNLEKKPLHVVVFSFYSIRTKQKIVKHCMSLLLTIKANFWLWHYIFSHTFHTKRKWFFSYFNILDVLFYCVCLFFECFFKNESCVCVSFYAVEIAVVFSSSSGSNWRMWGRGGGKRILMSIITCKCHMHRHHNEILHFRYYRVS